MNKMLSGKKVKEILSHVSQNKQKAIQLWWEMEMDFLAEKYPHVEEFQTKKVGILDYVDSNGTCDHCGNYNIRYMLFTEDIRAGERTEIACNKNCLQKHFNLSDEEMLEIYAEIREKIRMRNELLLQLEDTNYMDIKYPTNMRIRSKIDVLTLEKLPVPKVYALDVKLEADKLRAIQEKSIYYMKYKKYIRYVRLSLKLQPRNPFLLSIQERMKKNIPLTPGIMEALEKGMEDGWEDRLKDAIENMEKHSDDMVDHERRLNKLLMCKCGFSRQTILSFRNQLRRGKPLTEKQIETLEKWEQKFATQLGELNEDDEGIIDKMILA